MGQHGFGGAFFLDRGHRGANLDHRRLFVESRARRMVAPASAGSIHLARGLDRKVKLPFHGLSDLGCGLSWPGLYLGHRRSIDDQSRQQGQETKGFPMKKIIATVALGVTMGLTAQAALGATLEDVKAKGYIQCGVTSGTVGFSAPDANNNWTGLEVDFCRAMSAAIFNDPEAVRYTPLTSQERFTALSAGEIDVLSRTTTWTMSRDTQLGIKFIGTMFYDGQGFMVREDLGVTSALELSGAAICIESGTTTELNAADYFAANGMDFNTVVFIDQDEVIKAYEDGRCDVYTTDSSALASERSKLTEPAAHIILPEIISKEPLGPVVRQGDDTWFNIARWTYFALLEAEELGITQANVDDMLASENPAIRRLLGVEGDFGTPLGLTKDWAYQIIKHIGNYAESYERHVGPNTPIGLARGLNALWRDGGIQYSPPIR
ncbi:MAG: amino acid ABC transporter substrate-binding protein [Cucumibacter sp.]